MEKALYNTYLAILKEELVPAMGCTEPIAVAYAAALAARALGCPAEQAEVAASANIMFVCRSCLYRVDKTAFFIYSDMCFIPEVPCISLFRRMCFRITFLFPVLCG